MKPLSISLGLILCLATVKLKAQDVEEPFNMVKLHLTSLAFKTVSLQYERVISRTTTAAIMIQVMPKSGLPFKNAILNSIDDEGSETETTIDKFRLSRFSITPEMRFYIGREGYGRGFYIAPFYRFTSSKSNELYFYYDDDMSNQQSIALSGKLNSHTGGFMLGAQWAFGRSVVLDWWILGPHYGVSNGEFKGVSSETLSASEQNDLRQELEDTDIPLTNKTVTVTANGANMKFDGPWGGIRAGFSIGVRF